MKKIFITVPIIFILIVGLAFTPFNKQIEIQINALYFNSYRQLFDTKNWHKWQHGNLQIKQQNSNTLLITQTQGVKRLSYIYTVISSNSGLGTLIAINLQTTVLKALIPGLLKGDLERTGIDEFKHFMETPKLYYGYSIIRLFTSEKKMIVITKTTVPKNIYAQVAATTTQLNRIINNEKLKSDRQVVVQYLLKPADSVQVSVGMAVDRQIASGRYFTYMHIPSTNMLVANFSGSYSKKMDIYTAVSNYIQDKYLVPKIAPMEVFVNKFPSNGHDITRFRLVYSIF